MTRVLVIAVHPDDETLGAGGAIQAHVAAGDEVHWFVASQHIPSRLAAEERHSNINAVREAYGLPSVHDARWPAARLDAVPVVEIVEEIHAVRLAVRPDIVYLPYAHDAHSDHRVIAAAALAACKVFRAPSVKRVLYMETLSETPPGFVPNWYVPLTAKQVERKIAIIGMYKGEMQPAPFPRSPEAIRALATLRGCECGERWAEGFQLVRGVQA
jgi:LmbE family N-acetylglucosaminyl deacetylase